MPFSPELEARIAEHKMSGDEILAECKATRAFKRVIPEKCPACKTYFLMGSMDYKAVEWYHCGTQVDGENHLFSRSSRCYETEIATLKAENLSLDLANAGLEIANTHSADENQRLRDLVGKAFIAGSRNGPDWMGTAMKNFLHANGLGEG